MKWQSLTFADLLRDGLIEIQTGPFGTQLKASHYTEHGIPVINVRNIGYGRIREDKLEFVPDGVGNRLSQHLLTPGDIVFGRKGAVDRHVLVQEEQSGWMQGSDCIRLRTNTPRIRPLFLSYFLLRESHKQWMLTQCSNKATMASLNQDVICRIPLQLPSPEVQSAIADTLSAYDDLIENNRRRIQLLEESARLLYKEWFVHLRFPGHEHVNVTAGVPQGWKKKPLGEVLTLQRGFDLPSSERKSGDVPIYASTGVNGYHSVAQVKGPGVVTGRSGSLGTVIYVHEDFWPLNTTLWVKEFMCVGPLFATHLLKGMSLEQYNGGAAVPTLNRNDVHRVEVLCPPRGLHDGFVENAEPIYQQMKLLAAQNAKLARARDLLLPRLMSGEIEVAA